MFARAQRPAAEGDKAGASKAPSAPAKSQPASLLGRRGKTPDPQLERLADAAAERAVGAPISALGPGAAAASGAAAPGGPPAVQRKCAPCATGAAACPACEQEEATAIQRMPAEGPSPAAAAAPAPTGTETRAAPAVAPAKKRLLVDPDQAPEEGQMVVTQFMTRLRAQLVDACNAELAVVGRSADDCPYLQEWLAHYQRKSAQQVERSVRLYAPPAGETPEALLAAVTSRVRIAARVWAYSGMVTGIPSQLADAANPMNVADPALETATDAGVATTPVGVSMKQKPGAPAPARPPPADHPAAVQARLGGGQPIDGGARTRMERAFARDFSQVRVHTGSTATGLNAGYAARAFTVGNHIAFGDGEYRPGTVMGDLLLAHELAHTVQQSGATSVAGPGLQEGSAFEDDADQAALGALTGDRAAPERRSGLGLQGCNKPKVKVCPKGKEWSTVGTSTGLMATCTCKYACTPLPPGKDEPARLCANVWNERHKRWESGCDFETVDPNYPDREGTVKEPDTVTGLGGYSTPIGADHVCLCPGVEIDGDETGRTVAVGIVPVSGDITDLVPTGRNPRTGIPGPPVGKPVGPQRRPPAPISEPLVPKAKPAPAPPAPQPTGPVNWRGKPVQIPTGHKMSPVDPAMHEPPIVKEGPFTDAQRDAFRKGTSGGTKLAPHHRHQIPTTQGGVIDELRGPGHPHGNEHTAGSPSRHPGDSVFRNMPGGEKLRKDEIKEHWQAKGDRLEKKPNGLWYDPGPKP